MNGSTLPKLLGADPMHLVGFAWDGSAWHQVPVQVDERDFVSPGEIYHLQSLLRWSSGLAGAPLGDMHVAVSSRAGWHAVGRRIGSMYGWINKSYSKGRLRLGTEPDGPPDIDFRMLSDPRDLVRLMQSFRMCHGILAAAQAGGAVAEIFPTSYSARIKTLIRPNLRNLLVMSVAGPVMDASVALRRRMIDIATEDAGAGGGAGGRRHETGGLSAPRGRRRLASLRHLPDGRPRRPDGRDGPAGAGDRRGGPACVRRLSDAHHSVREPERPGPDDG
jgi:hypothetical protein